MQEITQDGTAIGTNTAGTADALFPSDGAVSEARPSVPARQRLFRLASGVRVTQGEPKSCWCFSSESQQPGVRFSDDSDEALTVRRRLINGNAVGWESIASCSVTTQLALSEMVTRGLLQVIVEY